MNTALETTINPGSPAAESALDRVIREKTAFWQQEKWAVNHLKNSGVRPRGLFAPVFQKIHALLTPHSRVIDVGCGHGRLAIPLAEAGHTVVATDVSRKMLDLLAEHKGTLPIEIRLGDAHGLAAADGEFDAVISSDFMPHFPDWPRLLKEKARVCRAGGKVIFAFNFSEHKTFAGPLGGGTFDHPYSPDVNTTKPFWAECSLDEMINTGRAVGLELRQAIPIKFLNDSFAIGGALGSEGYRKFQAELTRRVESDPAVADFFAWLETDVFQHLPFFAAYSSLVVFERSGSTEDAGSVPSVTTDASTSELSVASTPVATVADPERFLGEIPSETSLAERLLLFNYFRDQWDGLGNVVEIGPFLGGTTRAIAAGMCLNPRLSAASRLHTFDRFDEYYSAERLRQTIQPLVRCGAFNTAQADELCRGADFERLFNAIHQPHAYARIVHLHNSPLPDRPDEIDASVSLRCLAAENDLGALFIDGCKSWASTHYALKFLLPRLRTGAPVIFQDFGWYTCFWISSATHALRDYLELETHADSTYVFRLQRPITAAEVEARFSRAPAQMSETFFRKAHAALLERSQRAGDLRGELIALLHHVAALATLGQKEMAIKTLQTVDVPRYAAFVDMINGCLKSPTYLPGGKQILW